MPAPLHYEIRVAGWLDACWFDWFDELTITNLEAGEAILSGPLPDQAALHSVLGKIRDLNLAVISVKRIEDKGKQPGDANEAAASGHKRQKHQEQINEIE